MTMTVLENLYNGNINIVDKAIKKGSEYDRLAKVASELEGKLMESISGQEKELFENIFITRFQQEDIMLTETFSQSTSPPCHFSLRTRSSDVAVVYFSKRYGPVPVITESSSLLCAASIGNVSDHAI